MNEINPYIFREYDIRGVMDQDISSALFRQIGQAFAAHLRAECHRESLSVVVGRDGRHSSPILSASLIEGLVLGGLDVTDIGLVPTPALYFAMHHAQTDAGIMITGSHNPSEYNGIKMVRTGKPIFGVEIQALKRRLEAGNFQVVPGGRAHQQLILDAYLDRIVEDFHPGRPLKVVLDCGNGATGDVALALVKRLPNIFGEVLFAEIDGDFPNHHPDPTVPANLTVLKARMQAVGADLGIAFDGDGDRIGVLDNTGRILWGDSLMILFARDILSKDPGAAVIGDVKCSQLMFDAVAKAGGEPIMWKTGHSLIKDKMRETGAPLAGEMSGHLFFADRYLGYDDALYAAVRLLELAANSTDSLAAQLADLPEMYSTPELRIPCSDELKFDIMERVLIKLQEEGADLSAIDGARVRLNDGWWLLRVSNTQPMLVVRAEAQSQDSLYAIVAKVATILEAEGVAFPVWQV